MMPIMKHRFDKHRLISFVLGAAMFFAMPALALARNVEMEKEIVDARLEGYAQPVSMEGQSAALMWVLLVFMGIICLSVMFKNAKRTHLD
jgi:hypothetical protein